MPRAALYVMESRKLFLIFLFIDIFSGIGYQVIFSEEDLLFSLYNELIIP